MSSSDDPPSDAPQGGDEPIELAAVARAQGLSGEVQLKLFNRDSELLLGLDEVRLRASDGSERTYRIETLKRHGQALVLKLQGVDDRTAAEALRGSLIGITRSELPEPAPGEYYFVDLVGLGAELSDGTQVGEVSQVQQYPSVECLVIERDGVPWEIPVLDRYVVQVDLEGGRVILQNLDELEDLQPKPRG